LAAGFCAGFAAGFRALAVVRVGIDFSSRNHAWLFAASVARFHKAIGGRRRPHIYVTPVRKYPAVSRTETPFPKTTPADAVIARSIPRRCHLLRCHPFRLRCDLYHTLSLYAEQCSGYRRAIELLMPTVSFANGYLVCYNSTRRIQAGSVGCGFSSPRNRVIFPQPTQANRGNRV
jgi:hypothetical protein